jgi:osmotically-inducible protein OsmY
MACILHLSGIGSVNGGDIMDSEIIRDHVREELRFDPRVTSEDIDVLVNEEGIVALVGEVGSYREKMDAGRAAGRIAGVRAVANDMHVILGPQQRPNDERIRDGVVVRLGTAGAAIPGRITVSVAGGWVSLSGEVEYRYMKRMACEEAGAVPGVIGVIDNLSVSGRGIIDPLQVKQRLEMAFHRLADLDAMALDVGVEGSTVALQGRVETLGAAAMAEAAASYIPGVTAVDNRLLVSP